ncbi:MAG: cobalt/nickel transport system ATP-binding protein [Actinomycetota bacterium]|nr:cobalt/nickel transport system ATP-binding protein [Actinomycetota bacterium]
MTPAIRVSGLVYDYPGDHRALDGVDLRIDPGERVALLGPNGAGKTTLALHLNGILLATAGEVAIDGEVVARESLARVRSAVGLVFQDPDDQLFMPTVAQDVAFGPMNFGVPAAQVPARVAQALAAVGMADAAEAYPGHLSFGQRRRVAIATVLSCRPAVMVLDEPTSNLDPAARRELAEVVAALDVTVLMVTHDLPFALQLCPRSVILDEGRVRADDATPKLLADSDLLARHRLELPFGFDPGVGTP